MAQVTTDVLDSLYSTLARRVPVSGQQAGPMSQPVGADRISFAGGLPDPKSLPAAAIAAATARAMEKNGEWALQYGSSQGYRGLIDQLRAKLARDNGVEVGPENVLITAGASQAIDLVCAALLNPGDVIVSEEPTWMGAVRMFNGHEAKIVGIPMDNEGMQLDVLEARLKELKAGGIQPKFIYTIPTFQNPTGVTTTLERRRGILALAKQYGVAVMEDDAYFDLRFSGARIPMMYTLDDAGLVIYTGTFSKIMAAGMRMGWVVGPASLIERLAKIKPDGGNMFTGYVAAEYAQSELEPHIAELVQVYKSRRDAMLDALTAEMPEGVTWTQPNGGFFLWLTLPEGMDATQILPESRAHGVEFLPGTGCYFNGEGQRNIRLSYSFADEDQIRRGIRILGGLLREYSPQGAGSR